MLFDLYRSSGDRNTYLATAPGAGLPASPIGPNDWLMLPPLSGAYPFDEDLIEADIADHGFCFFEA